MHSQPHGRSKHGAHHKPSRHVVGHHARLGARNPSLGRNLSKLNALPAREDADDDSSMPRSAANGSLTSPRLKGLKPNHSSVSIMPKHTSHSALRKNHSSGHLVRNSSAKQLSKAQRPEYQRSHSQPHDRKAKRKPSPGRQPTVHFDVGSDDDAEEMEGVDDGWTEESGSQSPNTTRDHTRENTRSNTRSNSVNLDHSSNPYAREEDKPPDKTDLDDESETSSRGIVVNKKDNTAEDAQSNAQGSSYQETTQHRPPDAEAIAKRLLLKQNQVPAPPQLSDVSVSASTEALDAKRAGITSPGLTTEGSSSSTPMISRFIDSSGGLGSKDSTPIDGSQFTSQKPQPSPAHSNRGSSDIKRNQSTPSFMTPHSPIPEGGPGSGSTTPGGLGHGGRIQQKMWLQRGLSEIESRSQQNLRGMLTPGGRTQRLGAQPDQSERIETELKVVRRYRHPVEESMERLRKLKDSPLRDLPPTTTGISPSKKSRSSRDGARTPGGHSVKTSSSPPSFHLPSATGDDDGTSTVASARSRRDWDKMGVDDVESLRELEDATLEVRRQMWELHADEVE